MKLPFLRVVVALSLVGSLLVPGYGSAQQAAPVSPANKAAATSAAQDKKVVKSTAATRKAKAAISKSVSAAKKKQLDRLVDSSIAATRAGRGDDAVRGIKELRAVMKDNDGEGSPWETCGKMCQHHLDDGNAPAYAVCYWACVIRGGPSVTAGVIK